jgi:hypothetical protein
LEAGAARYQRCGRGDFSWPRFILAVVEVRRLAVRALVAGLCVAAATAIAALASGDFDDTHWRVIATSLGFSVFSALGASGNALWRQADDWRVGFGATTAAAALIAFVSLILVVWLDDTEALWRAFGVSGLLALWGSHASLVLRVQRRDDPPLLSALVWTSLVTAAFDMLVADVAILAIVDDVSDGFVRLAAVVLVIMVLSTALPPLLRRTAAGQARAAPDAFGRRASSPEPKLTMASLADELVAAASRLDASKTPADARREADRLRDLAARARR